MDTGFLSILRAFLDPLALAALAGSLAFLYLLWHVLRDDRVGGSRSTHDLDEPVRPGPSAQGAGDPPGPGPITESAPGQTRAVGRSGAGTLGLALLVPPGEAGDTGVTLRSLIENIPTDPASLFVYALILGSLYLVWLGSRRKPGTPRPRPGGPGGGGTMPSSGPYR